MKIKLNNLLFLLMIPAFIEAIGGRIFIVDIPGSPLSLGRLGFVLSGIILMLKHGLFTFNSKILIGLFLVYLGITIGSLFTGQSAILVQSLGSFLLFVAACGNVYLWTEKKFRHLVDVFFIIQFSYWVIVSFIPLYSSGFLSYTEISKENDIVNHHIPGLLISVSSAYIAVRFFYINNQLSIYGYSIFFISIAICLFIESRSNFLISILTMAFLVLRGKKNIFKLTISLLPIILVLIYLGNTAIKKNEILEKRFTLNDMDYQERTTVMRLDFLLEGLEKFIKNPLGAGASDTRVAYNGRNLMVHNQYLTFLISGGLLALVGLGYFFSGLVYNLLKLSKIGRTESTKANKYLMALAVSNLTFFLTLATIEISGIIFFILTSLAIYSTREIRLLDQDSLLN